MESTECIAAHAIAAWSLSTSAAYVRATLSRANASTPAGVSRSVAVVVMGLLNQPPPTVLGASIPLCTRDPGLQEVVRRGLDTLAGARYSTTESSAHSSSGTGLAADHPAGATRRTTLIRWSSREGALA